MKYNYSSVTVKLSSLFHLLFNDAVGIEIDDRATSELRAVG